MILAKNGGASVTDSDDFMRGVIDVLPEDVAVLDRDGGIILANRRWRESALADAADDWLSPPGGNYFAALRKMAELGNPYASRAEARLRAFLCDDALESFALEYPRAGADGEQWFLMQARRAPMEPGCVVVTHRKMDDRELRDTGARVPRCVEEPPGCTAGFVRSVLDSLPHEIVVIDQGGMVLAVNQRWERFARENGATHRAVAVGADYLQVVRAAAEAGDDFARRALAGLQSVIDGARESISLEYPCHASDREQWFVMTASRADFGGAAVLISHTDITDRKKAEDALRQSQQDFVRAQEVGQIGWWRLDTRRNVLTWSDECYRIFGVPRGQPLNYESFLTIVHPDDGEFVDRSWAAALRGEAYDIEHRIVVREEIKWLREKAFLEFDLAGALLGGFGITQDITDRKRADEALRQSEANLRRQRDELDWIYQNAPVGLCVLDLDLRYVRINHTLADLNGHPVEAHIGKTVAALVPALAGRIRQVTQRILATGEPVIDVEFRGETAAQPGVRRFWNASWYPVFDEEARIAAFGAVVSETTERRAAEKALQARAARQAFVVRLGDALRPLTDPIDIQETACRLLGQHLRADRVYYGDLHDDARLAVIRPDYHLEGLQSVGGQHYLENSPETLDWLKAGRPLVIADTREAGSLPKGCAEAFRSLGAGALAAAPLLVGGKLVWTLNVVSSEPRDWSDEDVKLVSEVAERTWDAVMRALAETALRESEQRERRRAAELQAIFDTAPIGLSIALDPRGERIIGNRACEQIYGLAPGAELSKAAPRPPGFRVFRESRELLTGELPMQRAVRGEAVGGEFVEIVSESGQRVIVFAKAMPLYDEDGNPRGAVGAFLDVTKMKIAEDALRESEQRFRSLVESYAQAVWETNADGVPVADNPSWRAYTGQSLEEFTRDGWASAVHPDDRAYAAREWAEAVRTRRNCDLEYRLKTKDAGWRWTNVRATPILAPDGSVLKWTGMNIDIHARKQAEAALRESEARLEQALDAAHAGVWEFAPATGVFSASPRAMTLYGLAPDMPMTNERALAAVYEQDRPLVEAALRETLDHGASFKVEMRAPQPDGSLRWLYSIAEVRGEGEERRLVGLVQDTDERKRREHALRESEAAARRQHDELDWIYQNAPVGLCILDLDLRFMRINKRLADINGLPVEAHIGRTVEELFPGLAQTIQFIVERILATGESVAEQEVSGETPAAPGVKRYWSESWQPYRNDNGEIIGFGVVVEEITERRKAEQALRESLDRYELVLAGAGDAIWDWDVLNHKIYFSPRWKELHGYDIQEVVDQEEAWRSCIHPQDAKRVLEAVQAHFEGRSPFFSEEYRIQRRDGQWRWVQDRGVAQRDAEGHVVRMAGSERDVTQRMLADQALRESELRLQLALESGDIGILEWRLDRGEFICDDRLLAQWGLPAGAPTSQALFMQAIHPADRDAVQASLDRALDPQGDGHCSCEYRVVGVSDTVERWIAATAQAFFDSDRAVRLIGTTLDITERKHAEAERQKFVSLADQSVEFIGICDMDFRAIYVNPAGIQLVGLHDMATALRTEVKDCFFPEDQAFILDEFFPKVMREGHANVEIRFRHFGTGKALWMLYNVFFLRGADGEPMGLATVSRDITERKRFEDALRAADRRKDEFLATLAHELRNPLAPIRNAVHVLRHDASSTMRDARDLKLLGMIERQVQHLIRLVDDLLEVSRITRGKIELKKETIDLATILQDAIVTAEPTIERGQHRLEVSLPPEPLMVDGDPVRLAQVFTNLLNNAAKYTEHGGVVSLAAERKADQIIVTLRDNGVGIPAEMLPRVFDLFTQVDRTLGRAQGGLGIGLALVRSLLELHGGTVEAQSEGLGRGSVFVVRLPAVSENKAEEPMVQSAVMEKPALPRRILVIDDDHDVADSLVMLLETFGAEVRVAYGGAEALEALAPFKPELIFLDLGMPQMDGYETARRIRALPEGRDVTLVALTGWGQEQVNTRARDAGFDRHLTKPAGLEALQDLLGSI